MKPKLALWFKQTKYECVYILGHVEETEWLIFINIVMVVMLYYCMQNEIIACKLTTKAWIWKCTSICTTSFSLVSNYCMNHGSCLQLLIDTLYEIRLICKSLWSVQCTIK